MHQDFRIVGRFVLTSATLLVVLCGPAWAEPSASFEIDTLLEGVWLFRAPEASPDRTNSLVIERDHGLLVVEAQPSPTAARQLLRAISEVSDKPIQYLVLTHAHTESSGGASAFPETALVIASPQTRAAFEDGERDLAVEVRGRLADPDGWSPPPRAHPEMLASSRIQLVDGKHEVELLPIQSGHYPGFIVVRIESAGLYYVGSLLAADRNPYADPDYGDVRGWISTLNGLSVLRPETVVPLHGPATNVESLRRFRDALAWVVGQVENAFIEGKSYEEALPFAMDSPKLGEYFDLDAGTPFFRTLFELAREDAVDQRRKRGGS